MRTEHQKGDVELAIFRRFAAVAQIRVAPESIQKRLPPEPDILCEVAGRGNVAFELVELCDERWASGTSLPLQRIPTYLRTRDPTPDILTKKLGRAYTTNAPIELVCYVDGAILTPEELIVASIHSSAVSGHGPFQRIWLLSRGNALMIWQSNSTTLLNTQE